MKTLMMLTVMMSLNALAYDVPKDAIIKVFNKNGKQIGHMSRIKYKVVLIEEHPCKAAVIEVPIPQVPIIVKEPTAKNEVITQVGLGYTGVTTTYKTGMFSVAENIGFVGSLSYCRNFGIVDLCGSIQTNKTTLLGVKFGF